jgi:glycosyltransferase involved in cell wall biosynthesis
MNKFLIVDFGASLNHTHHKQSIFAFNTLLKKEDINFDIWIPFGSEIENMDIKMNRILLPGTHPCQLSIRKLSTWLPATLGKLNNLAVKYRIKFILFILLYITAFYFYVLLKMRYKNEKISIIFTTTCPFALMTIRLMELFRTKVNVHCRITNTAEIRGVLADLMNLDAFKEKVKNFKYVDIFFGFETKALLNKNESNIDSRFSISKFPSEQIKHVKEVVSENFTISFLGFPTRNKGHNMIGSIIKKVGEKRPNYEWQVQLYQDDPLIHELNNLNLNIKILEGKISRELMVESLKNSTLICLPYDVDAFKYNSSAMMYESTDYLVPVITFYGSAFATDVDDFFCGVTVKNKDEMIDQLINLDSKLVNKWIKGCSSYNDYRNKSNLSFLHLNFEI